MCEPESSIGPPNFSSLTGPVGRDLTCRIGLGVGPIQDIISLLEFEFGVQQALAQYPREAVFPLKAEVGAALLELD